MPIVVVGSDELRLLVQLFVALVSDLAFAYSFVSIMVYGQRVSLRENIGLHERFFEQEKKRWKDELVGFPNLDKITKNVDGGRFVKDLFDRGLFNLAVLWSCSVVEETVDSIADGITSRDPTMVTLFKNERGGRLPYPKQIENLGYSCQNEKQLDLDSLWHRIRDPIAHHKYMPTFCETEASLKAIVSILKEIPSLLRDQKTLIN